MIRHILFATFLLTELSITVCVARSEDVAAQTIEEQIPKDRLPIPDEVAQKEALALIRDVYKADYDKAKSPPQVVELAKKLLHEGLQTKGDPTGRYVLLRVARDLATQAGNLPIAMEAVDAIGADYAIDPLQTKADTLARLTKSVGSAAANKSLLAAIKELIDEAVAEESLDVATKLADMAIIAARNSKNPALVKEAAGLKGEIQQNAVIFAEAQKALATLEESPTDPEANLVAGKFRCFFKGDWESGLPLLALSDDAVLKPLAEKELAQPGESGERVALGDAWWSQSEKTTGRVKTQLRLRAERWYKLAAPNLSGLPKAKVEKRLAELAGSKDEGEEKETEVAKTSSKDRGPKKNVPKSVTLVFTDETPIKESWTIKGNWRLQDNAIRFVDNSSLVSQFRVRGDSAMRVDCTNGVYMRIRIAAWGQQFVAENCGTGFVIERQKNEVVFTQDGQKPVMVKLREDELEKNADTDLSMAFESNSYTPSHVIKRVTIQGEVDGAVEAASQIDATRSNAEGKWTAIKGVYRTDDPRHAYWNPLILEGTDAAPQLFQEKDGMRNAGTDRWSKVEGGWLFGWVSNPIDLFVVSPLDESRIQYSVFWKSHDEAFRTGAIPNRPPDETAVFSAVSASGQTVKSRAKRSR